MKSQTKTAYNSLWKGFGFSCIACCLAEAVTLPIDVVKTRLQLQGLIRLFGGLADWWISGLVYSRLFITGELGAARTYNNAFHALRVMWAQEGLASWWKGLTPALLRYMHGLFDLNC